jgi:hypothetical protein
MRHPAGPIPIVIALGFAAAMLALPGSIRAHENGQQNHDQHQRQAHNDNRWREHDRH